MTSFFSFLQELECIPEKLNGHDVWDLTQLLNYVLPISCHDGEIAQDPDKESWMEWEEEINNRYLSIP